MSAERTIILTWDQISARNFSTGGQCHFIILTYTIFATYSLPRIQSHGLTTTRNLKDFNQAASFYKNYLKIWYVTIKYVIMGGQGVKTAKQFT